MEPPNRARIKCFGGVAICNFRCLNPDKDIWIGQRVTEPGTPAGAIEQLVFSRRYSDGHDLDNMLYEHDFTDSDLLGIPFLVVPKEKIIFGYEPASDVIVRPPIKLRQPGPMDEVM